MDIIDKEDVRGKKGERYIEYSNAVKQYIIYINEILNNTGKVIIEYDYIVGKMGGDFTKKSHRTVYLGLKFALHSYGIDVKMVTNENRDKVFIMSYIDDKEEFFEAIISNIDLLQ